LEFQFVWRRMTVLRNTLLAVFLALAGCAAKPPESPDTAVISPELTIPELYHVPDFARVPFEPFDRANAVGIAMAEWRAFGQLVDDDPPHSRPPLSAEEMPDRMPGLWQKVGVYWWLGQNANRKEDAWTGMHSENGDEFEARRADYFAWSAGFISYVMRLAGAGSRFPYSSSHSVYINIAARQALGRTQGWVITARRPQDYAPMLGDIICTGRDRASNMRFERLPARPFPSHCDIVVAVTPDQLSVIGGNVDAAVTMKHVPVSNGLLAGPGGSPVDTRYDWFVVLQVAYAR
jgi:Uncharacterized protein conserved in bacteria (DUF2272)